MIRLVINLMCLLFAVTAFAQEVKEGTLLGTWNDSTLVGSAVYNNTYNEIWGYASGDKEYGILGSVDGTHFIDVTDPENVVEVFFVAGRAQGPQIIHRDYHDHNGFLYAVCDEGSSSLQIMDLSFLPDSVSVVYDSNELIQRTHNIFIDESTDRLYSCAHRGVSTNYSALRVLDISDPINPVDLGGTNSFGGFQVGHVHDVYAKDNIAYLNCGRDGFAVADLTNIDEIKLLATLKPDEYAMSGYNHSGWLSADEGFYYMADEDHNTDIKVLKVDDLNDLEVVGFFDAGNDNPFSIPHNQIIQGDYLYCSYYYDGLQVYSLADPMNPKRVMEFSTSKIEHRNSYEGSWGVFPFLPSGNILVSDMQEGLFVVEALDELSSIQDIQFAEKVYIYPNPVSSLLSIDLPEDSNGEYLVTDMSGRSLLSGSFSEKQFQIEVANLSMGTYVLKIFNKDNAFANIFVVTK